MHYKLDKYGKKTIKPSRSNLKWWGAGGKNYHHWNGKRESRRCWNRDRERRPLILERGERGEEMQKLGKMEEKLRIA